MRNFFVATGVAALAATAACQALPTVTVSNGPVAGTTTRVPLATATASTVAVSKYIGIPYASNPPLRFAPPQSASTWTRPIVATATKPACIQQFVNDRTKTVFNNPGGPFPQESEDCLYLNVYTPPGAQRGSNLPVLFWVFGGNLAFGTGGLVEYDGSSFAANQGVILVTHNYRTNIFGFSMSPEIPLTSRNAGFLDQRLALKWVRDNIAAFGGSPDKITLFGQSAGGESVEQLIAYPPSPLSFRAAILESKGLLAPANGTSGWDSAVLALGCSTAADQLTCMRSKSATEIQNKTASIEFGPVLDGATFINDIRPRLSAKLTAQVPVMLGTAAQEGNVFAYILGLDQPGANATAAIRQYFGNIPGIATLVAIVSAASQTPYHAVADVITDFTFLCTTSLFASTLQAAGYPVWRYLYSGVFPTISIFPDAQAFHASEIPSVYGNYPLRNEFGYATQQQIQLSKYTQTAWANFAKNPAAGPQLGWPQLGNGNVQDLGGNKTGSTLSTGYTSTIPASSIDGVCAAYYPIIALNGF